VKQIDGWLIAEHRTVTKGDGTLRQYTGTINTCANSGNNGVDVNSRGEIIALKAYGNCAENQLVINGPVYAQYLALNRTYTNIQSDPYSGETNFAVHEKENKGCTTSTETQIKTSWDVTGAGGTENWGYNVHNKIYNWTGGKKTKYRQNNSGDYLFVNNAYVKIPSQKRVSLYFIFYEDTYIYK
jgi:hypothetical protein